MRGTAPSTRKSMYAVRITPAHAGNRSRSRRALAYQGDHPRTCGEQSLIYCPMVLLIGSPPHMRGTAVPADPVLVHHGITPAHAGNRSALKTHGHKWRDHPRTCGEQPLKCVSHFLPMGSPPHMRGTAESVHEELHIRGITPAHAGNSIPL